MSRRNKMVEEAINSAIANVRKYLDDPKATVPTLKKASRLAVDSLFKNQSSSVALACFFLVYYKLEDWTYDFDKAPTGMRGKFGDKKLSSFLNEHYITLHGEVTAFGENIGYKGNSKLFSFRDNAKFSKFTAHLDTLNKTDTHKLAYHLAWKYASSQHVPEILHPIDESTLTYAKAKALFHNLLELETEGMLQQFLIAGLLNVLRARDQITIRTHHPHSSDRHNAGDIEELDGENRVIRAYEVTVRPDWKNRIPDFRSKMDKWGLRKYIIIAGDVNNDPELSQPANLIQTIDRFERDIAVIDIYDVVHYLAQELSHLEIQQAVQETNKYLRNSKLCGRSEYIELYRDTIGNWLDSIIAEEDT